MSKASLTSTCKAWQYTGTKGGIEQNLFINNQTPVPKPKPDQHLVRVIAASINPVDYKPAEVWLMSQLAIRKPATPGADFVGRVVTPADGSSLKPDQLVFGTAGESPFAGGSLSQFAIVTKEGLTPVPEGVEPIDAASIGIAGNTAYQCVVPHVKSGSKVFINGGSGGTGVFGIQIAKAVGCYVATTCSTRNVELCQSLGADQVIDYTKQNVVDALKASGHTFDHVIDNVGSNLDLYWRCHEYTNHSALYMNIAGSPTLRYLVDTLKVFLLPGFLGGGKRKYVGFFAKIKADELKQIGIWMQDGKLKAVIDQRYPFEQVPEAFTKLKTWRTKGKIIIDIPQAET